MNETWAIAGVDLHLDLAGPRRRAALENALRQAVATGRLPPDTRLPSTRALASDLGLARNTVADAYGQLVAEGWLVARVGAGTRVARRSPAAPMATRTPGSRSAQRLAYDLRPGTPDLSTFPRSHWTAAARRALGQAPDAALGYADPRGIPSLRQALADYLGRTRGVRTNAEQIIVCAGFSDAFRLICAALQARGAGSLAVESHVPSATVASARAAGLRVTRLSADEHGQLLDGLGEADALLLTPAHQFPLGAALSAERRSQAATWARAVDAVIIEDDYDGEFRYDRHPLGALQAHAPEHIIYAGTASKTLAPGLRLGWLAAPEALYDELLQAAGPMHRGVSTLEQLTLAEFIRSGAYDRHIRRCRIGYRRRRDRLVASLAARCPGIHATGIAAGLHALVPLPAGLAESDVIAAAAERDLALEGLSAYRPGDPDAPGALVVGYATPPEHAFEEALARLRATLEAAVTAH